jgi:hypothetical protein
MNRGSTSYYSDITATSSSAPSYMLFLSDPTYTTLGYDIRLWDTTRLGQKVTKTFTTSYNKLQQVTTSYNKLQQVTTSYNKLQQVTTSKTGYIENYIIQE